jgi:hypothetical protein
MQYFSEGTGLIVWSILLALIVAVIYVGFNYSKKKDYSGQTIIPLVLIALSLVLWAETFSFPSEEAGPALIPRLWIFWLVLLCLFLLLSCFTGAIDKDPKRGRFGFLGLGIGLVVVYYFAIDFLGYFLSSFLFLAITMYMLSYRKPLTIIIVCTGWVAFSYLVFYKMLYIQLPLGLIEDFI